ncbi:hypothetical protein JW756_01490 [Candidatus Woesearchaeota archaeon]|nr:hypothetical protein [Candidatus Woesearchaeota archaeon]
MVCCTKSDETFTEKACSSVADGDCNACCPSSETPPASSFGCINDIHMFTTSCPEGWIDAGSSDDVNQWRICYKKGYQNEMKDLKLTWNPYPNGGTCNAPSCNPSGVSGWDEEGSIGYSNICYRFCSTKTGNKGVNNVTLLSDTCPFVGLIPMCDLKCPDGFVKQTFTYDTGSSSIILKDGINGFKGVTLCVNYTDTCSPPCNLRDTPELCTIEGAASNCAWCPVPLMPDGSVYPYVLPNQEVTVSTTSAVAIEGVGTVTFGNTCVDKTIDPFNCGGCGFTDGGTHKYFTGTEGGFCKADTPFCVNKVCVGINNDGAADSAKAYRDLHSNTNPYYQPYDVTCDPATGCKANIEAAGYTPAFSYDAVDTNPIACAAAGGTFTEGVGCCGNNKCRSDGKAVCDTTKICDGTSWHLASDETKSGEVFKTAGCFNSFPIVNMGGEFVKCIDEDKYDDYITHIVDYDTDGCLKLFEVDPNRNPEILTKVLAYGGASEGSTTWKSTGSWQYSCPAGYYQGASVRVHGSVVGAALEPGCGLHATTDSNRFNTASLGGYLVCTGDSPFGFASLISTGARGLSFKNMEFTKGTDSSAFCPAPILEWEEYKSGRDVSVVNDALIPCPGKKLISPSPNAHGIYVYGAMDGLTHAQLCVPGQQDDGWQAGLYALDYVIANGSIMGNVSDHNYICYTDYSQTKKPGLDSSRAKIAICCGIKGCTDIPGSRDSSVTKTLNPGQYIVMNNKTLYCLDDGTFSSNLDGPTLQNACTKAGLKATGTYCCSEKEDFTPWGNESYNDYGSTSGACFKGQFQPNNNFLLYKGSSGTAYTYNEVYVQNGKFYGCGLDPVTFSSSQSSSLPEYINNNLIEITGAAFEEDPRDEPIVGPTEMSNCVKECIIEACSSYACEPDKWGCQPQCINNCEPDNPGCDASKCNFFLPLSSDANPYKDCENAWCAAAREFCSDVCKEDQYVGVTCYKADKDRPSECRQCVSPITHANDFCDYSQRLSRQCLKAVTDWPDPGTGRGLTAKGALIERSDYCTILNTPRGDYYCSYVSGAWTQTYENLSHKSEVPKPLMDYFKNVTSNNNLRNASCCLPNQCWDPTAGGGIGACIAEQLAYNAQYKVNETAIYKCLQGMWVNIMGAGQKTPNGCYAGFCSNATQCLYNIAGNPADNGNVDGNPQCINNTQYIKDSLCQSGNWTSRTKLLAMELVSLTKNTDKFTLTCGTKEDVLIDLPFAAGKTNNYCVLNLNGQRIIGTTINQQFYNATNHTDFITTVEQNFLQSYPGAKFNFKPECLNEPGFTLCVDNAYLKLYYDSKSKMIVFSDQKINELTPSLWNGVCSSLPSWLSWMGWLCPKPASLQSNLEGLQLFNKLYATNLNNKKIFGVGENACKASAQPAWFYSFNYTGFSVSELSFLNISESSQANVVSVSLKNPPAGAWNTLTLLRNPEE